jgi:hypothetical protein
MSSQLDHTSHPSSSYHSSIPQQPLSYLLLSVFLLTAIADWLFYDQFVGVSLGIYSIILLICIVVLHRPKWTPASTCFTFLFLGSIVQSFIETSFSNSLTLIALLIIAASDSFLKVIQPRWARWIEGAFTLIKLPGRWFALLHLLQANAKSQAGNWSTKRARLQFGLQIVIPTILILIPFSLLLSDGNAILGQQIRHFTDNIVIRFQDLAFPTLGRWVFWIAFMSLSLGILMPSMPSKARRYWTEEPPSPSAMENNPLALWKAISILSATNLLFLTANGIDALYLWVCAELPQGTNYSEYVHQGVYNLILTVILSALTIIYLFQRSHWVASSRAVRVLAILWIAQDLFLISSIFLRLKLYIDVYHLSLLRVYVGCFLLLVITGFGLLTFYIVKRKSLRWLFVSNAFATFTLFFSLQFLNVNSWVADYNVDRWDENRFINLDISYLDALGSSAWPSLIRVAKTNESGTAKQVLYQAYQETRQRQQHSGWKAWQWREAQNLKEIEAYLNTL